MSIDGDVLLEALTIDGSLLTGEISLDSSGVDLEYLEVAGSLESAMPLYPITISGVGYTGEVGQGDVHLQALTLSGGTQEPIALEALTVAGSALTGAVAVGDVRLEDLTLSGSLEVGMALEALTVDGVLIPGQVHSGDVTLESLTVNGAFDNVGDVTLEAITVAGVGLTGEVGQGDCSLWSLGTSGTLYVDQVVDGAITLQSPQVNGIATSDIVTEGMVILPELLADGVLVAGSVATAQLILPVLEVNGTAFEIGPMVGSITLPLFQSEGGILLSPRVATATLAINTQVRAVSTYEGVSFNSFAKFNGVTLAATNDGIVALTGQDDLGTAIDARLVSGVTNFGLASLTRILAAYVSYRASGEMRLTLITDEHEEYSYQLEPMQYDELHPTRVKTGRGAVGGFWQWKLENINGCSFDLNKLSLLLDPMKRRV